MTKNTIEKTVRNEANVYRHFKTTSTLLNEPIPAWVKKAQARFKSSAPNIPKNIDWAKKTVVSGPHKKRR